VRIASYPFAIACCMPAIIAEPYPRSVVLQITLTRGSRSPIARTAFAVPSGELSSTTRTDDEGTCFRISGTSLEILSASL